MSPILQQLEQRIAALDAKFGRQRRAFVPFVPERRGPGMHRAVAAKLGLPTGIQARIATAAAFKANDGNLASLLVCRTAAVVEACIDGGVPAIRDSLLDLAAFAVIWADCVEALSQPRKSAPRGAPRGS